MTGAVAHLDADCFYVSAERVRHPELTGKPVHSDLAARKLTLPVAAALTSGTRAGEKLRALFAADPMDSDSARMADLVQQAGGRRWAQTEADRRAGLALEALDRARPEPAAAVELRALVELACRRDL